MVQFKQQYGTSEKEFDRDSYRTPPEIFDPLNQVFQFRMDGAADRDNALCSGYFTKEADALSRDWRDLGPFFINPPYSGGAYGPFLQKAEKEFLNNGVVSVLLVPASLETRHFESVWRSAGYLIIPHKRIAYLAPDGTPVKGNSFLSAIAAFCKPSPQTYYLLSKHAQDIGHIIDLKKGLVK